MKSLSKFKYGTIRIKSKMLRKHFKDFLKKKPFSQHLGGEGGKKLSLGRLYYLSRK